MYDDRLKPQRDYEWGLACARQEGLEEGLKQAREQAMEKSVAVGKIQQLQELLGDELTSSASLREQTIDELSIMVADLLQRYRSRES